MQAEPFQLLVEQSVRALGNFLQLDQFLSVEPRAAVVRSVVGQLEHALEDDLEKAVSKHGDFLLKLHEVAAEDEIHDLFTLVLRQEHPERQTEAERLRWDEGNVGEDPGDLRKDHKGYTKKPTRD